MSTVIPQRELDNHAGKILDRVEKNQEDFIVTKSGRPVARIVPVVLSPEEEIEQLVASGRLVARDDTVTPNEWLSTITPLHVDVSTEDLLNEERGRG